MQPKHLSWSLGEVWVGYRLQQGSKRSNELHSKECIANSVPRHAMGPSRDLPLLGKLRSILGVMQLTNDCVPVINNGAVKLQELYKQYKKLCWIVF